MTERLLTARAVAELLGVSPATVLRWTRRSELPANRLPSGRLPYRAAELEAWLDSRGVENAAGAGEAKRNNTNREPAHGVMYGVPTTPLRRQKDAS